ncbi:hypothetical protein VB735_16655 [Halotia wernerae UHCC 0503]|nr:hypothetical protein [Halotia wernerae UHCC 0503]
MVKASSSHPRKLAKVLLIKENFSAIVSEIEVAVMKFGWWRAGVLSFSSGHKFIWSHNSPFSSESMFLDENQALLISFKSQDLFNSKITVKVSQDSLLLPELSLLTTFGCYVKTYREILAI